MLKIIIIMYRVPSTLPHVLGQHHSEGRGEREGGGERGSGVERGEGTRLALLLLEMYMYMYIRVSTHTQITCSFQKHLLFGIFQHCYKQCFISH